MSGRVIIMQFVMFLVDYPLQLFDICIYNNIYIYIRRIVIECVFPPGTFGLSGESDICVCSNWPDDATF